MSCLENLSKVSTSCKIFNSPERLVYTIQHSATEKHFIDGSGAWNDYPTGYVYDTIVNSWQSFEMFE